jgi:hypothetical protein
VRAARRPRVGRRLGLDRRSPAAPRPRAGRRFRAALLVVALACLLLGATAAPAGAHAIGTGTEPSNYRTTLRGIEQAAPGVSVRTVAGDELELTNRSGREVVVLGYRLEPYLRVGPDGAFENRRSPSAYTNRFRTAPTSIPPEYDPQAAPEWRRIGEGPSVAWHDHRAHWTGADPPAVTANPRAVHVVVPDWQIPLRQGELTMVVHGAITWVPGPSPWPWALAALAVFAGALAAAGGYRRPRVLAVVAVVAVAADAVHAAGALLASTAPLSAELYGSLTTAAGWAVTGLAAVRLWRGRADTGLVYLLLGGVFLTLAGALPDLSALSSSQVPSAFGPVVTRAAITLTLALGASMVAAGIAGFRSPRRTGVPA